MRYAEMLLAEFDDEMANTRKVLERIPDDRLDWQAHPKSHTIGWNANHVADMVNWLAVVLTQPDLDLAPVGGKPYDFARHTSKQAILEMFDRNVAAARKGITELKDEDLNTPWTLARGGQVFFTKPRWSVVRQVIMNHIIHHRSNLCVYLRLNDVPVPGMYGPSGDE